MKKDQALTRLSALENEAKELRKIIEESDKPKMEDIKTWEDVCLIKKIDPKSSLPFPAQSNDEEKNINAYFMLTKIAEVLNEGWKPDWNNHNEKKWYPYFDMGPGFAFTDAYCEYAYSLTSSGSRLCFKDENTARYAGKQFLAVYENFLKK